MVTFLKGLLALPVVVVAVVAVFWIGEVVLALLGAAVAVLSVAVPFLLKVVCVGGLIIGGIYVLGKIVSSAFGGQ